MLLEEATAFTKGCFNGESAPCSNACPFRLDVRTFLDKCARQKWNAAYKAYRNAVIFPAVVSALCKEPCREKCHRKLLGDESVSMGLIERAVCESAKNKKPESYALPPKEKKIAVLGAGLAGLACALDLANKKYPVTVFDKAEGWGGHLRSHELFSTFDEEFSLLFASAKAEFVFGREISSLDELSEFDAVYVATGKGGNDFGLLGSWDSELEYTERPGIFLGGELCGRGEVQSIAAATKTAKVIECYVQTGRAELMNAEAEPCDHALDHSGEEQKPRVIPADGAHYTKDEAAKEAERCMMCDCTKCIDQCELLSSTPKKPTKMAVEVYTDANANPPIATHELTRITYSCNDCGHCKRVCSEGVDVGSLLRFARENRFGTKNEPKALHWFWLREMDAASREGFYYGIPGGKKECSYAFFPGCQLGASNPDHVLKSYDFLKENYEAGIILGCCGAPAYWAGDIARREENAARIKAAREQMGRPTLIFACATCENMFKRLLPDIPRVTLYELLDEKGVFSSSSLSDAAVFDPCAAAENDKAQKAVRSLCEKAGVKAHEHPNKGRCCGYGGQMKTANRKLFDEIASNRVNASDLPYVVWCANCREVFADKNKDCAHILDIVFGLTPERSVPSLNQKRMNSAKVLDTIMKDIEGKTYSLPESDWDSLKVTVSPETERKMDDRLITLSDVKETILKSEQNKEYFVDPESGHVLYRMVTEMLTYWVECRKEGDTYEIIDAYAHRMHFKEGV